jgi:hypothetical protein
MIREKRNVRTPARMIAMASARPLRRCGGGNQRGEDGHRDGIERSFRAVMQGPKPRQDQMPAGSCQVGGQGTQADDQNGVIHGTPLPFGSAEQGGRGKAAKAANRNVPGTADRVEGEG